MSPNNAAEHLARLESMVADLERQAKQSRRELDESLAQRAAEAREGRLGKDWQDVQQRVDAGVTTVADVFSGRDDSPAARRLAELSRQNLASLSEEYRRDPENVEELNAAEAHWSRLRGRPGAGEDVARD
jgi:hypothetical protein